MTRARTNRLARWVLFATAALSFYLFVESVHFRDSSIADTVIAWFAGRPPPTPVNWIGLLSSTLLFPMTYALSPLLLGTVHGDWASAWVAYPGIIVALTLFAIGAGRRHSGQGDSTAVDPTPVEPERPGADQSP